MFLVAMKPAFLTFFLYGKYLTFDSKFEHSNAKTAHLSPGIVHQEKKDGDR